ERLCNPACALGKKLDVPVFQFLKEPLLRLYGDRFFQALEEAARRKAEADKT
ncbi:MAG: DUF3109 family protein, partial [Chitinophagaceae bacterium]